MKSAKNTALFLSIGASLVLAIVIILCIIFQPFMDKSGQILSDGSLKWNGTTYIKCEGISSVDKILAMTSDKTIIYSAKDVKNKAFIYLDDQLMVDTNYKIEKEGKINISNFRHISIKSSEFIKVITELLNDRTYNHSLKVKNTLKDEVGINMLPLYVGYENSPISAVFAGYMGKVEDKWYITVDVPLFEKNDEELEYDIACYLIPEKYYTVLDKYNK